MEYPDYILYPPQWLVKICQYHRHDEGYEIAEDVWAGMIDHEIVPSPECGWNAQKLCVCQFGTGAVTECPHA